MRPDYAALRSDESCGSDETLEAKMGSLTNRRRSFSRDDAAGSNGGKGGFKVEAKTAHFGRTAPHL